MSHCIDKQDFIFPLFAWLVGIWIASFFFFFKLLSMMPLLSIHIQAFVWTCVVTSLGYICKSEISGSYNNCIFNFLRNYQTIFQSRYTILHSTSGRCRFSVSSTFPTFVVNLSFFIVARLVGRKWYLIVVLVCMSWWLNNVVQSLSHGWLCSPMDCSALGFPVLCHFPELAQTHVHRVSDAIQPSHPLSSPSPAFNLSQHQALFYWVDSLHQVAKGLALPHQSF